MKIFFSEIIKTFNFKDKTSRFNYIVFISVYWLLLLAISVAGTIYSMLLYKNADLMSLIFIKWDLAGINELIGNGAMLYSLIFFVIMLLPVLAATTRRLNDIGSEGIWSMLTIVPFVREIIIIALMLKDDKKTIKSEKSIIILASLTLFFICFIQIICFVKFSTHKQRYVQNDEEGYKASYYGTCIIDEGMNGYCYINYIDSDYENYAGICINNLPYGYGIMKYSNGDSYKGEWIDGIMEGNGVYTWEEGDVYEGDFSDNNLEGYGKLTYKGGTYYEGEWVDNDREGYGKMTYESGAVYEGEWEDNEKEGNGKMIYSNGSCYEGEWVDGDWEGYGKMTYEGGSYYEGEWADRKREGYGEVTYSDGSHYEGEWEDDEKEGYGKMTYSDGSTYSGYWVDGYKDGSGIYMDAYGKSTTRVYDKGVRIS